MDEATPVVETTPEGPVSAGGESTSEAEIEKSLGEAYDAAQSKPDEGETERPRDDKGRYASKEIAAEPAEKAAEPAAEETTDQPQSKDAKPAEGESEAPQAIDVPNSWSADVAEKWSDLPPDVQGYIAGRESEAHKQITQQGSELKEYQPMREVIDHFGPMLNGREPASFVSELFQAAQQLESNPLEAIKYLANAYGVDLAQIAPSQPASETAADEWADPAILKLQAQVAGLGDLLTAQNNQTSAAATQQEEAHMVEADRVVAEFKEGKEHWDAVETDVGRRIGFLRQYRPHATREVLLEEAYQEAILVNPDVRAAIAATALAEESEKRQRETETKQKQAKTMAAVNVGSETSAHDPIDSETWDSDEAMSRLYDRASAV